MRALSKARRAAPLLYLELTGTERLAPARARKARPHIKRAVAAAMRDCIGTALRTGDAVASGPGAQWFVALLAGRSVEAPARRAVRDADLGLIAARLQSAVRGQLAEAVRARALPGGIGVIGGWTVLDPVSQDRPLRELRQAIRGAAVVARIEAQRAVVLAGVTHELRTPLTSIIGYAERLRDQPRLGAAQRNRYVDVIAKEGRRLHRLVEGLIDLGAWNAGQLRLSLRRVGVAEVLRAAWLAVGGRTAHKNLQMQIRGDAHAWADRERLEQILINLLDNAARHSPSEGWLRAGITRRAGRCCIEIADEGPGVAARLGRLGEPFTPGANGKTGLGLSIATLLVRAHGGELTLRRAGGRTIAQVILPMQDAQEATQVPMILGRQK